MTPRRAFVVGAYGPAGGSFMNYEIGRLLHEEFGLEVIAGLAQGQSFESSFFDLPVRFDAIPNDSFAHVLSANDVLLWSPFNSGQWVGLRADCRFKIMHVQGFNVFQTLDVYFDHYVCVSRVCSHLVGDVYGLPNTIIPAFVELPSVAPPSWHDRPDDRVAYLIKGDKRFGELALEHIQSATQAIWPRIQFDNLMEGAPLRHTELLARLSGYRYLLNLAPTEGFGLVPLEAMARGVAVVGFDGFGGREYMEPGINCCCYPMTELAQITSSLTQMLSAPEWAQGLGAAGIGTAQRFSREAFRSRWSSYLRQRL